MTYRYARENPYGMFKLMLPGGNRKICMICSKQTFPGLDLHSLHTHPAQYLVTADAGSTVMDDLDRDLSRWEHMFGAVPLRYGSNF